MKTVTLVDTAYILSFQTSTVLYRCFKDVRGYWDMQSYLQMLMYKTTPYTIRDALQAVCD